MPSGGEESGSMGLTLDVFVSSPGDMAGEREIVAEVVAKLAQQPHVRRFCTLRALTISVALDAFGPNCN